MKDRGVFSVNIKLLTARLFLHPRWPFYLVLIISLASQIFTAIMNIINSLLWWGRVDLDLILIGCIDSLVVTLFVAPVAIYLIRHSFNLEEMNRNLQKEIAERIMAEEALRDEETRLRILSDSLPMGLVYQIDSGEDGQQRRFSYISAGVEQLHGLTVNEVLDNASKIYGQVFEEDIRLVAEREALALANMTPFSAEVRLRLPSGEIRWRLFTSAPRRLANNHLVWDGVEIDITEQKRIEEERVVMSKLESTGILAGGIAHDFNNLLSVILGNVDLLQTFDQTREEKANSLEAIKKATFEARGLTKQLITFSQGGSPIKKPASLADMIQKQVNFALSGSAIDPKLVLAPDLWMAEVDESQMGQVIRNIVLNAREAMSESGTFSVTATNVESSVSAYLGLIPGVYVNIRFSDEGEGIPEEVLPKIFDPYFSTKQRGTQKGMGLGLTICRSIIQKHDGIIQVNSELGRGTTFDIYLPSLGVAPPKQPEKEKALSGKGRILVMDDEEMVRKMCETILTRLGYKVELAENGQKALELYQAALGNGPPFDVVFLDLTVRGGMGGLGAIQALHTIDPQVTAVVMSGYDQDPVMQQAGEYGFKGALIKPFQISDLQNLLVRLFQPADFRN
jgi:PAS domain S-box-containing protein